MTPAEINRKLTVFMGWKFSQEAPPHFKCPSGNMKGWWQPPDLNECEWLCADCQEGRLPNPYYNRADALDVVEKMTLPKDEGGLGYYCRIEILPLAHKEKRYRCTFYKSDGKLGFDYRMDSSNSWKAYAATLQASISLAALEVKGEKG